MTTVLEPATPAEETPEDRDRRRPRVDRRKTDCVHCGHARWKHRDDMECRQKHRDRNGQRFICNCTEWRPEKVKKW